MSGQNQMFGNLIIPGQGLLGGKSPAGQNFGSIALNNKGQLIGQDMRQAFKLQGWNPQECISTGLSQNIDLSSADSSMMHGSYMGKDRIKFDVLKVYENMDTVRNQSILTGGLDIGLEIGKFVFDTSQNRVQNYENYAERFIGPYART